MKISLHQPKFLMSKKHLIEFDILDFLIRQKQPPDASMWKGVLSNITKFTEKHLCQSIFFNKKVFIKKENLAQVFSCEFCEISKNTFFEEHLWTTACAAAFIEQLLL